MCEVGPIDCDTNAMCLDRDGGYDCECSTGYSGNGTYCEGIIASFPFISMLQSYISSSDIDECTSGMIHVISMPHVSTLLVAMTVNVCQVSWEMDSIVQVSMFYTLFEFHNSIYYTS